MKGQDMGYVRDTTYDIGIGRFPYRCTWSMLLVFGRVRVTHLLLVFCVFFSVSQCYSLVFGRVRVTHLLLVFCVFSVSQCYSFSFLVFGRVRVTHLLLVFCVFQFLSVTPSFWSSPCYSFTFSFLCFSVSQCYS